MSSRVVAQNRIQVYLELFSCLFLRHNWQLLDLVMSRREDPVAPGRGRGSECNRFESGRGGFRDRGLTPAIGAYLDYAPGLNTNISYISIWSTKIKEHVNTVCETRVDCIFGSNGTVEDYHVYVELEEDEQAPD